MREASIERVVLVFPGALGDLLLALPALRSIAARHAGARRTLAVNEPLRAFAHLTDVAQTVVSLDAAEAAGLFGGSRLPTWMEGRPRLYTWLGARDDQARARLAALARVHFFTVERGPGTEHAAAVYSRAVGAPAGIRALAAAARVDPPASRVAEGLLERLGRPVLAIHPGAGTRAKRWDAAGFVQVGHWWRQAGGGVVEIGGPAEAGEPPLLGTAAARDWPLPDLAALLARSDLYLGNDSGVSHLAGAVGTAGVVLFGPTAARRWRPLGRQLVTLQARAAGPDAIPLDALPSARVIAALRRRIALTRKNPDISVPA